MEINLYICTVLEEQVIAETINYLFYCVEINVFISCLLSPDGGIGRRAGLKHLWETVPVRLRLRVLKKLLYKEKLFIFKVEKLLLIVNP